MTITPTLLFYDTETTGLNCCFDQIIQFAAIRTDLHLQELERVEFHIKPNCDVIPAPEALLIHQIPWEKWQAGLPEYEAIQKIHATLNTPGTISLGYNTLGFDEELLRFSFYRNLLTPYTHQYANQCSRMDIYPMLVFYLLFKPDVLQWPTRPDGKLTLKLDQLNQANQFVVGKALHNAMTDVAVTLQLTERLKTQQESWDYLQGYFNKNEDQQRLQKILKAGNLALLINGRFGSNALYHGVGYYLGTHTVYKQSLWLRLDDINFADKVQAGFELLAENFFPWVTRKKLAEPPFLLPWQARFSHHLCEKRKACVLANQAWLAQHPDFLQALSDYYISYTYPRIPNLDIDAALYQNAFATTQETAQLHAFHRTPLNRKLQVAETFSRPYHREQAIRILGRHYPQALSETQLELFQSHLQTIYHSPVCVDYKNRPRRTLLQALEEIQHCTKDPLSPVQQSILNEYKQLIMGKIGTCIKD